MSLKEKAYSDSLPFIVALDGPAASGKGLIGRQISDQFKLKYIDSGAIYRSIAYHAMQQNTAIDDINQIIKISNDHDTIFCDLNNQNLYTDTVALYTSQIAKIQCVRDNVDKYLQRLIAKHQRIVIDGRDIGTVVAPFADLKIFITANIVVRAKRRFKQLQSLGKKCIMQHILSDMQKRDELDSQRRSAPLKAATDALIVDTSDLTPDQILKRIIDFVGKS